MGVCAIYALTPFSFFLKKTPPTRINAEKFFKIFLFFFEKGIDKFVEIWYNIGVIGRDPKKTNQSQKAGLELVV